MSTPTTAHYGQPCSQFLAGFAFWRRVALTTQSKKSHNSPDARCKFLHGHTQEVVHTQMNLHKFLVNPLWETNKSTKIMTLILEKPWPEKESAFEKRIVVFLPPPWAQEPVLLGWEKDVIPSSQISTCSTGHNSALGLSWRTNLKKIILSHVILKSWWVFYINFSQNTQAVFHPGSRSQDLVKYHSNILTSLAMWVTHSSPQKILKWHDILMKLSEHLSSCSGESMLQFLLPLNWNSSLRGIARCACWPPSTQGCESDLC